MQGLTEHIGMCVSVQIVADDRVTDVREMNAKLMCATCDGGCLHQRITAVNSQRAIVGQRMIAALLGGADAAYNDALGGATQVRFDLALGGLGGTL